jgi:outer membrane lipoprotein SlyB
MRMSLINTSAVAAACGLLLAGCYTAPAYSPHGYYEHGPLVAQRVEPQRVEYGVVESIDWYRDGNPSPIGLGAVLGGVAGGVLGHQIGSGRGNTAATIAGALGGAYLGNEIEHSQPRDRYRVVVRLDSGASLALTEVGEGELRIGDRVRVVNNRVYRV